MNLYFSLLIAGFLGWLILTVVFNQHHSRCHHLLILSISLPLGISVCSIILFWSYIFDAENANILSVLAPLLLAAVLMLIYLRQREPASPFLSLSINSFFRFPLEDFRVSRFRSPLFYRYILTVAGAAVFFYAVISFIYLYASALTANVFGGWDTKFIWHLKAKFFFRDPASWKLMFSPLLAWSHQDYPLLVPGAVAWGWTVSGAELHVWPGMLTLAFSLATAGLLLWHFGSQRALEIGFLAAAFLLGMNHYMFWTCLQYTDIYLCFFILAGTVFLVHALRTQNPRFYLLTGLAAGLSLWTKLEGIFFTLEIFFLLALLFFLHPSLKNINRKSVLLNLAAGLSIPLITYLYLKMALAPQGQYWGSGRNILDYAAALFTDYQKTRTILANFAAYLFRPTHWNLLWVFFCTAIFFRLIFIKKSKLPFVWIPFFVCLLSLAGYFVILHLSPLRLNMQIITALGRLLLHASMPALVFIFECFIPRRAEPVAGTRVSV